MIFTLPFMWYYQMALSYGKSDSSGPFNEKGEWKSFPFIKLGRQNSSLLKKKKKKKDNNRKTRNNTEKPQRSGEVFGCRADIMWQYLSAISIFRTCFRWLIIYFLSLLSSHRTLSSFSLSKIRTIQNTFGRMNLSTEYHACSTCPAPKTSQRRDAPTKGARRETRVFQSSLEGDIGAPIW